MQEIKLLVGCSGQGKSTYAIQYIKDNPNFYRVNRDDIRKQLVGTLDGYYLRKDSKFLENRVTEIQHQNTRILLQNGSNIIIDNCHLSQKYIDEVIRKYNHMATITIVPFTSANRVECKKRVAQRDGVDTAYIDRQWEQAKQLFDNLEVLSYPQVDIKVKSTENLSHCIICDLDGTLSLYDSNLKGAYDRDFENDTVSKPVCDIISAVPLKTKLFFFSGRAEKFRKQTMEFLTKHLLDDEFELVMRKDNDQRKDSIVKLEMFYTHIREKYNVDFVVDDRLQVIEECWEKLGLFVFNVNQGNKIF